MSTPTQSKVKGKFDEVAGRMKQAVGETVNNQSMANSGTAQQVKGHAEQAWGSVKQAASDVQNHHHTDAQAEAHDARERVTSTAQNAKEHIEDGADRFRANHQTM